MSKAFLYTIFATIVAAVLIIPVQAVGLSVSPTKLEINLYNDDPQRTAMIVKNASNEVALFEVYPDDFESLIRVMPASFVLEAGLEREVSIEVRPDKPGKFKTDISVVTRPLSSSAFNVGGGLKIPLYVEAGKNSRFSALASIIFSFEDPEKILGIVLLIVILAALVFINRKGIPGIKKSL